MFLAIYFEADSLQSAGFSGRDEIEDPLDEALTAAGLGEVTGGGSGERGSNIDIDINDEKNFDEALALIRKVLRELHVPATTVIKRYEPQEASCIVYE